MPTLKKNEEIPFKANESLPLLFADIVRVSSRKDGMILVQFAAAMPNEFCEQTRLIVPPHAANGLIDLLCEMSGHYPSKPQNSPATAPAKQLGK